VKGRRWLLAISALLTVAAGWYLFVRPSSVPNRVYRIGWQNSPPFQVRGDDGLPDGIAVDLVNEAARRRGIKLEWKFWDNSSESALRSKSVDLWPLITITPERLKVIHITQPYVQHEHCFLVRDHSPYKMPADLATSRIGMANMSIDLRNLVRVLPSAKPVPRNDAVSALRDVCEGVSDAAFMDRYTAITSLLQNPGCGDGPLRWIGVPQVRSQLGVGSTVETAAAADAIREEIGAMSQEGALSAIFGQWGFMSGQDLASIEVLVNARRREARLAIVALVFALLLGIACWQSWRLMRERTRTRQTEAALRESQERFMQAQKMESIGRLAGGVAHDFNNLLTVINGYSELLVQQIPGSNPMHSQVEEIRKAGMRATELTGQLLAFGRKQIGRPRLIDLNSLITESQSMLGRLLGEDIQLTTRLEDNLAPILADPGQLHQVFMNLAVNARDAMPEGGVLLIETSNEPETNAAVRISFTDNGVGMDQQTLKNIFEPFFTTKGPAKGTGLGLATVYGIVQQSRGWIEAASQPGQGTSFHVYFPRAEGKAEAAPVAPKPARRVATGTVLVVEDQQEVRDFAVRALLAHGYQVLQAGDALEALTLIETHGGPLHLLLTDVVLPGMNGRELAARIQTTRPRVKVIYTSGYTRDVIAHRGVLEDGLDYIPKPYTADLLAQKVSEALASA
jgi:signal transduction histidine kinase/CheY-like chemotaxis protein